MKRVPCIASAYCQNFPGACSFCIHSKEHRENASDKFVSNKCGSQVFLCARKHDFEDCYDCDPFDPPCSLFKCGVSFDG